LVQARRKFPVDAYIQEKQSVVARLRGLQSDGSLDRKSKVPKTLKFADVAVERAKVSLEKDAFFVHISDCELSAGFDISQVPSDTLILSAGRRLQSFGGFVGQLKACCVAPTYTDSK
jgi:hypothetical protein